MEVSKLGSEDDIHKV